MPEAVREKNILYSDIAPLFTSLLREVSKAVKSLETCSIFDLCSSVAYPETAITHMVRISPRAMSISMRENQRCIIF